MSDEEPKIIVDEDWKAKVQREREELTKKEADEAATTEPTGDTPAEGADASPEPPPASLTLLVTTLLTQAMAAMGQIPSEEGGKPEVNLPFAKHFIDLAGVIEEKTKGNLTDDESKFVRDSLHQVRMLFISVKQQHGK